MRKVIPYCTILAAKSGDSDAMTSILHHYSRYILYYSRRTFIDSQGDRYELVDEDVKQRIEAKLMMQIIYKFDTSRVPAGEEVK